MYAASHDATSRTRHLTGSRAFGRTDQQRVAARPIIVFHPTHFLRGLQVTVLHSGTTKRYSEQWDNIFSEKKAKKKTAASKKKAAPTKRTPKKKK